jgi:hypothetical protein
MNDGDNNLKSRLQELIKISEEVKILVGYLHFSGIKELHEILKNSTMKASFHRDI